MRLVFYSSWQSIVYLSSPGILEFLQSRILPANAFKMQTIKQDLHTWKEGWTDALSHSATESGQLKKILWAIVSTTMRTETQKVGWQVTDFFFFTRPKLKKNRDRRFSAKHETSKVLTQKEEISPEKMWPGSVAQLSRASLKLLNTSWRFNKGCRLFILVHRAILTYISPIVILTVKLQLLDQACVT